MEGQTTPAAADAAAVLRERGRRLTPQRRAVLAALAAAGGPLAAGAVHRALSERFPGLSLETVYRTLRLLVREGLVVSIALPGQEADRFELARSHHHHRICLDCGRILCLPPCTLPPLARQPDGFRVVRHVYEEYGYCADCDDRAGGRGGR